MNNPKDFKELTQLYLEMNLGFVAPQNGGVPAASVEIIANTESPTDQEDDNVGDEDASQIVSSVIEDLNHLKMDLDQGCQADAQIETLEKCCQALSHAIEKLGNNSSAQYQNGAFTGAIDNNGNQGDGGGEAASMNMV